jgi:ribose transport system permease protein
MAKALGVNRLSGVYLILLFILIFGLWVPDTFLTTTTLKNILSEQSITAFAALGVLFPLSVRAYDLSVANMLGLGAIMSAWLTAQHGMSPPAAIAIVLVAGCAVGAINGFIVVLIGVDSFIATLGMSSVLLAAIDKIADGQFITNVPNSFSKIANPQPLGIPILAFYVAGLAVLAWYVLQHTPLGRRLHATGGNAEAARLAGVATRRLTFWSLVASAAIASLAGALLTAKLGSASPDQGSAYLLPIFAAALLGTTQIIPGRVNVVGTIVAVIVLAVGVKGLQLAGAALWVTELFNGAALIVAVSAASLSRQGFGSRWRGALRRRTTTP